MAAPAPAQQAPRTLDVPANASWMHADTELILPPVVAGSRRLSIRDTGTEELDIIASYESPDRSLITTLYLFRSQVPSAPLWFDRSRTVLEHVRRPSAASAPRSFALPAAPAESGLRIAYLLAGGEYRSTALAVAQMGGWTVKARLSSRNLEPAALDRKLDDLVKAIRWPQNLTKMASVAAPVEACATPIAHKRARMLKPDFGQALVGSLLALGSMIKKPEEKRTTYCREPQQGADYGVYRAVGDTDGYLIALADSGRAVSVGPAPDAEFKKTVYTVIGMDFAGSSTFPSFNRLPPPEQVMKVIGTKGSLSSTRVGPNAVEISGPKTR